MEEQKIVCEKKYKEYKDLKETMDYAFEWKDYRPGEKIESRPLPLVEDMKRFKKIKKELKECKDFLELTPSCWYEIER